MIDTYLTDFSPGVFCHLFGMETPLFWIGVSIMAGGFTDLYHHRDVGEKAADWPSSWW